MLTSVAVILQTRKDNDEQSPLGDIYDGQVWMKFNSQTSLQHHTHKLFACIKYRLVSTIYTQCVLNGGNLFDYSKPSKMRPVQVGEYTPCWSYARFNMQSQKFQSMDSWLEELKVFWDGMVLPIHSHDTTLHVRVRLALSCVVCDIPASRKVCGFVGHKVRIQ